MCVPVALSISVWKRWNRSGPIMATVSSGATCIIGGRAANGSNQWRVYLICKALGENATRCANVRMSTTYACPRPPNPGVCETLQTPASRWRLQSPSVVRELGHRNPTGYVRCHCGCVLDVTRLCIRRCCMPSLPVLSKLCPEPIDASHSTQTTTLNNQINEGIVHRPDANCKHVPFADVVFANNVGTHPHACDP